MNHWREQSLAALIRNRMRELLGHVLELPDDFHQFTGEPCEEPGVIAVYQCGLRPHS